MYNIIYADPPWQYNDKMRGHSFSLDHEYETQDINWLKSLDIKSIAAKDCVLFMWVTSPFLDKGIELMESWGFKYITVAFCWSKLTKNGKKVHNLGRWTMGNVELCLLGKRGKPKRITNNIKQLIEEVRPPRHSAKPNDTVRQRIVELMGDLPRVELFARDNTVGWDSWGLESNGKRIEDMVSIK